VGKAFVVSCFAIAACGGSPSLPDAGAIDSGPADAASAIDAKAMIDAAPIDAMPLAPPSLDTVQSAQDAGGFYVHLGWTETSTGLDAVEVDRKQCGDITGTYMVLATLAGTAVTYDDHAVPQTHTTNCVYKVRVERGTEWSAFSSEVAVTP
jgi:hypothetical protein